jgi:ankyrin repeat protein
MMFADTEGRTPLHWAVDRGNLSAVEVLAKANADLNAKVYLNCLYIYCNLIHDRAIC